MHPKYGCHLHGNKTFYIYKKWTKKDCNVYKKNENTLNAKKLMERERQISPMKFKHPKFH